MPDRRKLLTATILTLLLASCADSSSISANADEADADREDLCYEEAALLDLYRGPDTTVILVDDAADLAATALREPDPDWAGVYWESLEAVELGTEAEEPVELRNVWIAEGTNDLDALEPSESLIATVVTTPPWRDYWITSVWGLEPETGALRGLGPCMGSTQTQLEQFAEIAGYDSHLSALVGYSPEEEARLLGDVDGEPSAALPGVFAGEDGRSLRVEIRVGDGVPVENPLLCFDQQDSTASELCVDLRSAESAHLVVGNGPLRARFVDESDRELEGVGSAVEIDWEAESTDDVDPGRPDVVGPTRVLTLEVQVIDGTLVVVPAR